ALKSRMWFLLSDAQQNPPSRRTRPPASLVTKRTYDISPLGRELPFSIMEPGETALLEVQHACGSHAESLTANSRRSFGGCCGTTSPSGTYPLSSRTPIKRASPQFQLAVSSAGPEAGCVLLWILPW